MGHEAWDAIVNRVLELHDRDQLIALDPNEVNDQLYKFAEDADAKLIAEGKEQFWTTGTTGLLFERLQSRIYQGLEEGGGDVSVPNMVDWVYNVASSLNSPGKPDEILVRDSIIANLPNVIRSVFGGDPNRSYITRSIEEDARELAVIKYIYIAKV